MVRREDHNRVLIHPTFFQDPKQLSHVVIYVAHRAEVRSSSTSDSFIWKIRILQSTHVQQALAVRVLLFLRDGHGRKRNILTLVPIPIFSMNGIRVMWVCERDSQAEWTRIGWTTSGGVEVPSGFEHDLLIEVELIRANAGASLEYRVFIVVPLKTTIRVIPIDGPRDGQQMSREESRTFVLASMHELQELDQSMSLPSSFPTLSAY